MGKLAFDIAYGNNTWVAVGNQSAWYSMDDGSTWTEVTLDSSGSSQTWGTIIFANGMFIASNGTPAKKYSTDGKIWADCTNNFSTGTTTRYGWGNIAYGNGIWVHSGNSSMYAYSTDGITWEKGTESYHPTYVWYCNDKFLASCSTDPGISYSIDGRTWTKLSGISSNKPDIFAYGNGIYVGINRTKSTTWGAYYSTDGINWTENNITSSKQVSPRKVIYFGKYFIICAGYGNNGTTNLVQMSTDGKNWTEYTLGETSMPWVSIAANSDSGKVIMINNNTSTSGNALIATCNGIYDLNWVS